MDMGKILLLFYLLSANGIFSIANAASDFQINIAHKDPPKRKLRGEGFLPTFDNGASLLAKRQIEKMHEKMNPAEAVNSSIGSGDLVPFIPPSPEDYEEDEYKEEYGEGLEGRMGGEDSSFEIFRGQGKEDKSKFQKWSPNTIGPKTIYEGCGVTKSCLGIPSGCHKSKSCRSSGVIWQEKENDEPNEFHIALQATNPGGYVALSFSKGGKSTDEAVLGCYQIPNNNTMGLIYGHNSGNVYRANLDVPIDKFLVFEAGYAQPNGIIACQFKILNGTLEMNNGEDFNILEEKYHMKLSFGKMKTDPNKTHEIDYPYMSVSTDDGVTIRDLLENPENVRPENRSQFLTHGISAVLAFGFFAPCSIYIAKYGRECFGQQIKSCWNLQLWLLILAVLLSVIMLIPLYFGPGGRHEKTRHEKCHLICGLIAIVCLWADLLTGSFIGTKGWKRDRNFLQWIHWGLGNIALGLGFFDLFFGVHSRLALVPCAFQYIAGFWIAIHCVTHIFMNFHTYYLIKHTTKSYIKERLYPGPMIEFRCEDMKHWQFNCDLFHKLVTWRGRWKSVIFYYLVALVATIGMIGVLCYPAEFCPSAFDFS